MDEWPSEPDVPNIDKYFPREIAKLIHIYSANMCWLRIECELINCKLSHCEHASCPACHCKYAT